MIYDKVKECAEKTRHISPPENQKRNKGKKAQNRKQNKEDIYKYPLGKSPCGSDACQKKCIESLDRRTQSTCKDHQEHMPYG